MLALIGTAAPLNSKDTVSLSVVGAGLPPPAVLSAS